MNNFSFELLNLSNESIFIVLFFSFPSNLLNLSINKFTIDGFNINEFIKALHQQVPVDCVNLPYAQFGIWK